MDTTQKIANEIAQYKEWSRLARLGSFDIADDHWKDFLSKMEALNNKAAKFGTLPIVIRELGVRVKRQDVFASKDDVHPEKRMIRVHRIVLYGETPKINGFEFVATIQHVIEGENIVRAIPGTPEVPASFFKVAPVCDHCKTNRSRKDTYIVRDTRWKPYTSPEWLQVGKSCLKDFTGINNPAIIAHRMRFLEDVLLSVGGFADRQGITPAYELIAFLAMVSATSRRDGYVSRAKADSEMGNRATSQSAFDYLRGLGVTSRNPAPEVTPEDKDKARDVINWVRSGMDTPEPKRDNFQRNLIASLRMDYITYRETGIAAAAFQMFTKAMEKKLAAETANVKPSEHVGTVGKRDQFVDLTCIFIKEIPGHYGATYLHKFTDPNGNLIIWFASNTCLDQGAVYSGKATIKEHSEFNGTKQTVIERAKFFRNGDNPNPPEVEPGDKVELVRDYVWGNSGIVVGDSVLSGRSGQYVEIMDSIGERRHLTRFEILRVTEKAPKLEPGVQVRVPNGEVLTLVSQSYSYNPNFWNCKDDQGRTSVHFVLGCPVVSSNQ